MKNFKNLPLVILIGALIMNPKEVRSQSATPNKSDVLTFGMTSEFENMNPLIYTTVATGYMMFLAVRPLVIMNPEGKWVPFLIEQIPTIENGLAKKVGQGLVATIQIKKQEQWGDGRPMTCRDLAFSLKVGQSSNVSIANKEPFDNIEKVIVHSQDPKKCDLHFKKAKFDYFANLPNVIPEHLEGPIFEKYKNQSLGYDHNSLYTKEPTNPGLYNGPYRVAEVKLGSHVVFEVNPNFLGKKPFFKKMIFKLIPNNNTLVTNLLAGTIDAIASGGSFGVDQAAVFEKKVKAENLPYQVLFESGVIYAHLDFNLDLPKFQDVRVRRALQHAINKKEMIDAALEGKGTAALHFLTEMDPWFSKDVRIYNFNRREANRLLDEAGWKMGKKGYREKDGERLSIQLSGASGVKFIELVQNYLQASFKAIGVELLMKNSPPRVLFGEVLKKRQFEMALFSLVSTPGSSPRSVLHSTMIRTEKNSWSGDNITGYKNPKMDELIDRLELELRESERVKIAHQMLKIYSEDVPTIPLYFRPNVAVNPKGLKNFRLTGHTFYETLFAENWSF